MILLAGVIPSCAPGQSCRTAPDQIGKDGGFMIMRLTPDGPDPGWMRGRMRLSRLPRRLIACQGLRDPIQRAGNLPIPLLHVRSHLGGVFLEGEDRVLDPDEPLERGIFETEETHGGK